MSSWIFIIYDKTDFLISFLASPCCRGWHFLCIINLRGSLNRSPFIPFSSLFQALSFFFEYRFLAKLTAKTFHNVCFPFGATSENMLKNSHSSQWLTAWWKSIYYLLVSFMFVYLPLFNPTRKCFTIWNCMSSRKANTTFSLFQYSWAFCFMPFYDVEGEVARNVGLAAVTPLISDVECFMSHLIH